MVPPRKRILDVEVDGEYAHAEVMFERWIADIEVHRDLARAERDSNRDSRFVVANRTEIILSSNRSEVSGRGRNKATATRGVVSFRGSP